MSIELDHVFLCTAVGAPEASLLTAVGLSEGSPNEHPGQGTACRRFFFRNAYVELFWVHNEAQARSAGTALTRLWERWQSRADGRTCPFGICMRTREHGEVPFATWQYRPLYLPPGKGIPIASNSDALHEPMLFVMPSGRRPDLWPPEQAQPLGHRNGVREVTRVAVAGGFEKGSKALAAVAGVGLVELRTATRPYLTLGFDHESAGQGLDLHPMLRLALRW